MSWFDIAVAALMVFLVVRGFFRGFFSEVGSLAGVVLGVVMAYHLEPSLTPILKGYLPSWSFLPLISFAFIFVSVLIGCNLVSWILKTLFRKMFLGWLDRSLGVAVAFVKGMVVLFAVVFLINVFPPAAPLVGGSKLYPMIAQTYQLVRRQIPPDTLEGWKKSFQKEQKEVEKRGVSSTDGRKGAA